MNTENKTPLEQFNKYVLIKEAELMTTAEELIAEAKRRYSIGTKFIPAHVNQNPDYFCIVCTTDFRYENDCLYAVLPDNTIFDTQNNPEYGNCDFNRIIFYKDFWATILPTENKPQFEVGKWYKNLSIHSQKNIFGKFLNLRNNNKEFWVSEYIYNGKFRSIPGWIDYSSETVEIDIEEIQQYLPDNHPDKIKPNQEFKVGDWVVWGDEYIDTIKRHCNSYSDSWYLSERYNSCSELALRHATPEEINNHLISIGQIPADEPLNTDSLKMILSIDDEELPMVSIIKTNSIKQLLNSE